MLADGIDWLNDVLDEHVALSVTYQRGIVSATVSATVGQTVFESDSEYGVLKIESRDYLISADNLTTFGEPVRGDKIIETQGTNSVTHEVLDITGIPPFSYCDQSRKRLRVHTKRITTA